jgi:leucyl-tRNA synthetase
LSGSKGYDVETIEARWRRRWAEAQPYRLDLDLVDPERALYNLVEFPYPSAEGLHVGHVYSYCGADAYGRYQRMHGREVFQPIGFDSFGIHTENFALRVGERPGPLTRRTIANYRRQLERVGAAWNWEHELATSDPAYYRWTQWVFLRLLEAGLAVRRKAPVVWCPSCKTVLAHEQLEDGRCERCGGEVTERVMEQWFLRITAYADRLLDGLEGLDWPEHAKRMQREWIGRSEGVEIDFPLAGGGETLTAFTTRPDTLFGVTFVAISPSHPLASRADGLCAVHPATGERVPVVVADYVVGEYATGVVMGVPAHDERDHAFASERGLAVRTVVVGEPGQQGVAYTGEGTLVDSGSFTGLDSAAAREGIADWLEESGRGRRAVRYRLHDWLISRQRYWGPPIPVVYCGSCGTVPVPDDQLPVLLPELEDFRPTGTGVAPLAAVSSFVEVPCPRCGGVARRETDVSDTFLDSAWYFLRYPSTDVDDRPWDEDRTRRLLPVDMYAGGPEHVVRHHLYARFVTMALHDLGLVPFQEPLPRIRLHGIVVRDGAKMSKSRGNVVNPDEYVDRVGADNLRLYMLFCGDWQEGGEFSDAGLQGMVRFTRRLWPLLTRKHGGGPGGVDMAPVDRAVVAVGADIERFKFNTAIARLMELGRWLGEQAPAMSEAEWTRSARTMALLLAPLAPHMAEEVWERLGGPFSVHLQRWPEADPAPLRESETTLVVQVNGKLRGRRQVPLGIGRDEALRLAMELESVRDRVPGDPRRVVYVPDRLLNLVV